MSLLRTRTSLLTFLFLPVFCLLYLARLRVEGRNGHNRVKRTERPEKKSQHVDTCLYVCPYV